MRASFGEKDFSGDVVFKMKNVAKAFGDRTLFSDVNLTVEGGEQDIEQILKCRITGLKNNTLTGERL